MYNRTAIGSRQQGVALVLIMLLLFLFTIFALGLYTLLTSETRASGNEYFSSQSFYAAVAGIEKMTHDLNKIYIFKTQPDAGDFPMITSNPPRIDGYRLTEYAIDFNGSSAVHNIPSGPFEGLVALVQPYKLLVTATGINTKSETRLRRDFLNNLIPLFQFGIFYDGDLEAHAGPDFNFGGRVHTNRDFYVTAGDTTTFSSRVTVFGEVVRDVKKNGDSAGPDGDPSYPGQVMILDPSGQPQELLLSGTGEGGSVIRGPGRPLTPPGRPNPVWTTYSRTKFGGNLINRQTGALELRLPLQVGGQETIQLIKRGQANDSTLLKQSRYFYKPGLRISLSNANDPFVRGPVLNGGGCIFNGPAAGSPPPCVITSGLTSPSTRLTGHLKVEIVPNAGAAIDVTQEILDKGITIGNPDAILHFQRSNIWDRTDAGVYPITFYDMREGEIEDDIDTMAGKAGIMTAVEINMTNLQRWLTGRPTPIAGRGGSVPNNNGYTIYMSDRRGEHPNATNGEFDNEDTIFRNSQLDPGEDMNGNRVLDILERPANPLDVPSDPPIPFITTYMLNEAVTFRRCLRLVNGGTLQAPTTVASENPIYVKGDYNWPNKKPASIVGDAITILSSNWNDQFSFIEDMSSRVAVETHVQAAFIAGNTMSVFADPRPPYRESHASGGVHNLMRFLEDWSGVRLTYVGSLVNLYLSRQAIGQYKCCQTVYSAPIRDWSFDVGFLDPANLPPSTPNITIVEIQRFRQDLFQTFP